jgi:hypothetical protein
MTEQLIHNKEVKVNLKAIYWLLASTITITTFIVSSYLLLKGDIGKVDDKVEKFREQKNSDDKYNDLRLRVMETNIKALEAIVENLRNQVSANREVLNKK